ncbi:hypothetical protein [Caulobacter hibisci]|uniref:Uncharacterized protein n=1 Tax=Caulobacter hibisci TaxID=2035993 RepID=A0ABS0T6M5_9CAUL|nr:hypothetical protein [Caulobacter hibisci]MBI1686745.1 hypothetical protein [Caulobacter hibisci]
MISSRVTAAVTAQMIAEALWPPPNVVKTFKDDWNFSRDQMRNFLADVQEALQAGDPPLTFEFDAAFIRSALSATAPGLIALIEPKVEANA